MAAVVVSCTVQNVEQGFVAEGLAELAIQDLRSRPNDPQELAKRVGQPAPTEGVGIEVPREDDWEEFPWSRPGTPRILEGTKRRLCVHRKGATRAFGPGHPDVPAPYRAVGQPVLVPGDMGRYSYVLKGTEAAMRETFGSSCHGAGRHLSRTAAKKAAAGRPIFKELRQKGIYVQSDSKGTVLEEIPEAYKDVSDVVDVMDAAGIALKVAKLVPLAVVKG